MASGYHFGQHRPRSSKSTLKIMSPQVSVESWPWCGVRGWGLTAESNKGTFGDDGNILYLDYNDGDMDIYTFATTHLTVLLKWVCCVLIIPQ